MPSIALFLRFVFGSNRLGPGRVQRIDKLSEFSTMSFLQSALLSFTNRLHFVEDFVELHRSSIEPCFTSCMHASVLV